MKKAELKPAGAKPAKTSKLTTIISSTVGVILILGYLIIIAFAKVSVAATPTQINLPQTAETKIIWPAYGQTAVGAVGSGVLATNGDQVAHPIASIAKVILAMAVLDKKPLKAGETGPDIIMTETDVKFYNDDLKQGGSLLPVDNGESLTEYQLLQGLLIASGDNIAETLATWAFGSTDNYITYANQMAAKLNLKETHIADDSGLSPQTTSSARDLIVIGEKALSYPIIAEIVNQQKATFPIGGTINNYNSILGTNGVIGIKTGNTPEAGGCLLFAVKTADATAPTVIGAILGATSRNVVLHDTTAFIQSNIKNFKNVSVVKAGDVVGTYNTPWGETVKVITKEDLTYFTIDNKAVTPKISLDKIKSSQVKGVQVGTISIQLSNQILSVPIILDSNLSAPKYSWKLLHPFELSLK